MSNYYKGFAVIKGAKGTVTMGAKVIANANQSVTLTAASPVTEHTDSEGLPRTLTRPFKRWTVDLELTPGVGATLSTADVKAACENIEHGDAIVLSGFAIDSINYNFEAADKAIVVGTPTVSFTPDGLASIRLTAQATKTNADAVVDFTAAWASIA